MVSFKAPAGKDALTFAPETLYSDIRAVLEAARSSAFRAVNTAMVQAYWQIGGLIVEHEQGGRKRAAYGEAVLGDLSQRLTDDYGRGFDVTNLRRMRQFYRMFSIRDAVRLELGAPKRDAVRLVSAGEEDRHAATDALSWSHYRLLMQVEDPVARGWYMNEAAEQHWSTRQLERQISVLLVDLKVGKLTHQDIGQMESYVRMFDAHARPEGDNPTIGLILCSKKNEVIARYLVLSEARQIFAAKYVKVLPTERELTQEIERERRLVDARQIDEEKR